jgi:membrane fusion protein (multidrug efflux system)
MARRMVLMLLAVGLFVAAIGTYKFLQIKAAIAQGSSYQPPPEAVTTVIAQPVDWAGTLTSIGTVEAVHGVILSADLSGVVKSIEFTSGKKVGKGQVLVRLDTGQERAQLAQATAQRDLAKLNLDRGRHLLERGVIAQAAFDQLDAEARTADAAVSAVQATIARKTIRAPFAGVLGIREVDLGQHLNEGDAIVPLQSLDPVYVNFALPQQDANGLKPGTAVSVSADSVEVHSVHGTINAVNSIIDDATRNVTVQATFKNPGAKLRPGMFVDVAVNLGTRTQVIALPTTAINYAPYGNSVYVVESQKGPKGQAYKGVSQRFVKTGMSRGDQVAVLSGLKPGEEVVTSGGFKLRPGAAVFVNNKIQPANSPNPKPEDS